MSIAMKPTRDWASLMPALPAGPVKAAPPSANEQQMEHQVSALPRARRDVCALWLHHLRRMAPTHRLHVRKTPLRPEALDDRGRDAYKRILRDCVDDAGLREIKRLSETAQISGRTVDTLVTRFPKYRNVCYYLDVTDPRQPRIVDTDHIEGRHVILFDIGESYRKRMQQMSKMYFDCFRRGVEVEHVLQNGETLVISLCQYMFMIWARQFCVYDFLKREIDTVVKVRKMGQKNAYAPIRKRRTAATAVESYVRTSLLCPQVASVAPKAMSWAQMRASPRHAEARTRCAPLV
jgi:hypothetical protein